ncbi:glycosyl transferase, partial [Xanthomonas oryzae pv. oryzae]
MNPLLTIATPLAACVICAGLIVLLHPLLARYALARPNARSSHSVPTPQGGGAAVIAAVITSVAVSVSLFGAVGDSSLFAIFAATVFLALVGAYDDLRTMPVIPRLLMQAVAVGIVLATL